MFNVNREIQNGGNQWQWKRGIPEFGIEPVFSKLKFGEPLQAEGNLTYLEFVSAVKALWEQSFPKYPIKPSSSGDNAFTWYDPNFLDPVTGETIGGWRPTEAIITYSLELRKTHTVEPKPKMRFTYPKDKITVYGQRFQNIIAFNAIAPVGKMMGNNENSIADDHDSAYLVESLIEAFEDFMMEYTPVFKRIGASELVYSRRLSDSEVNRQSNDVHKRTVTYMLTTEKLFGAEINTIDTIALDLRTYMSVEPEILIPATPNYDNYELNIVDLEQTATPNMATPNI